MLIPRALGLEPHFSVFFAAVGQAGGMCEGLGVLPALVASLALTVILG